MNGGASPTTAPSGGSSANGESGGDGDTSPESFTRVSGAQGQVGNYLPSGGASQCSEALGNNVKINQNCLNVSDPDLQGRGQANNEEFIAQDPNNTQHLIASDNNYIRGDGTCGAHYSLDGGQTWTDSVVPNSFSRGDTSGPYARQYWQAGGDTSVAWDSRGNAYFSCQVFNRGQPTSDNPDQSSGFLLFRSTQNDGASFNFPGRYVTVNYDHGGAGDVLEDKQLTTVDNNPSSPFRDRVYVTWTLFNSDGTGYIYESYSKDYGETFSSPTVVSKNAPFCTNTFGAATPYGNCNENQFSQPFVGPDGALYVVYNNYNNQPTSGSDNRFEVLLAKSTDGGQTFGDPVKVSDFYDLPDCDTYQGSGADPDRSCVPEKGSSTRSVFRAANYPSGAVDPKNASIVAITFGSYINPDSKESNGCTPAGFAADANPTYTGVKTPGACNNKIMLRVSRDGGASFPANTDLRGGTAVNQDAAQKRTDQWFQWAAFTPDGNLAVSYYDRKYNSDETTGSSDISISGTNDLVNFATQRVTSSSMPPPTEFPSNNGGQFYGDYVGLTAADGKAHPVWSDTRALDLFVCPGTATPGKPPALCTATEPNGQRANDEDTYTGTVAVPTGHGKS